MATDEKYGRLKQLMDLGKEKGYVLYDEVNELLTDDFGGGRELDDLLADFDTAGVEILEEPKLDFEKKIDEGDEFGDLDIAQDLGDKTNDPVRMYLREMGTVPLLTREGEIELAKRIERGERSVRKALSRSPLVIREILALAEDVRRDPNAIREILSLPETMLIEGGRDRAAVPEGAAIPAKASGHPARNEAQAAPFDAVDAGPYCRADFARDPPDSIRPGHSQEPGREAAQRR